MKQRLVAGWLMVAGAAAWAAGCGGSAVDRSANAAGAAGSAGPGDAGASESGSAGEAGEAGQAGTGSAPDPRAPFVAWANAQATALCERDLKCGRVYSVESCVGIALSGVAYAAYFGGFDEYDQQVEFYALASSAEQQTCLEDIAKGGCEDGLAASCRQVLFARDPLPKGGACRSSNPHLPPLPCAAGLTCASDTPCPTCVDAPPPSPPKIACLYEGCVPGLTCRTLDNESYRCLDYIPLGGSCGATSNCASGLACIEGTCVPYVLEGDACSEQAYCLPGLECGADQRCHPMSPYGPDATCARHPRPGVIADSCSNWCLFATPTAPTGKCGTLAPAHGVASACARQGDSSQLDCPLGSYRELAPTSNPDRISDNCACLPLRALGAACTEGSQCLTGRCAPSERSSGSGSDNGSGSVCSERLPAGSPCPGPEDRCAGTCAPETKQCEGPAVCAD